MTTGDSQPWIAALMYSWRREMVPEKKAFDERSTPAGPASATTTPRLDSRSFTQSEIERRERLQKLSS